MEEIQDPVRLAEHLDESLRHLPGPAYYQVLKWIHRLLEPANYVEIGVNRGISLVQALPTTACIGVDPAADIHPDVVKQVAATRMYALTSDEFFARHDLEELLDGPVALAFIDGLHLFEQVLRDFVNLERCSASSTVFLLHDCLPLDGVTASRDRTTDFYSGDVWKAVLALHRRRPELEMVTVPTAPTGLCIVRGLDRDNRGLEAELPQIVATYTALDFDYYEAHRTEMPEEIANDKEAVRDWLRLGLAS